MLSISLSFVTLSDIQRACDWPQVDQRLVFRTVPAVHASNGAARPTWRLVRQLLVYKLNRNLPHGLQD
jgi:hypothetical protein